MKFFVVLRGVKISMRLLDYCIYDGVEMEQQMPEFLEEDLHQQLKRTVIVEFLREKISLVAFSDHEVDDLLSDDLT